MECVYEARRALYDFASLPLTRVATPTSTQQQRSQLVKQTISEDQDEFEIKEPLKSGGVNKAHFELSLNMYDKIYFLFFTYKYVHMYVLYMLLYWCFISNLYVHLTSRVCTCIHTCTCMSAHNVRL